MPHAIAAGLIEALDASIRLHLTARTMDAALKASWIVCNLTAYPTRAACTTCALEHDSTTAARSENECAGTDGTPLATPGEGSSAAQLPRHRVCGLATSGAASQKRVSLDQAAGGGAHVPPSGEAPTGALRLAPLLIAHLGGGFGADLPLQCAWALGNLAASSPAAASRMVAQGAVPALQQLLGQAAKSALDTAWADAGSVAAWALCAFVEANGTHCAAHLVSESNGSLATVLAAIRQSGSVRLRLEASAALAQAVARAPAHAVQASESLLPSLVAALCANGQGAS